MRQTASWLRYMQGTLVFLSPVSCCSSNQTTSESGRFRTVFLNYFYRSSGPLRKNSGVRSCRSYRSSEKKVLRQQNRCVLLQIDGISKDSPLQGLNPQSHSIL